MIKGVTKKQQRVLDFYESCLGKGFSPTYQEAAEKLGISPSVVFNHVKNLIKKGYLTSKSEKRSVDLGRSVHKIPLLGSVACGKPIAVFEECDEFIEVSDSIAEQSGSYYALRAAGESMKNIGINSGDCLIIRKQSDVQDGEIGVVIVGDDPSDESATLKRVYHTNKAMLLKPENDEFPTTIVHNGQIRGKLVSVIRQY